jgi:hypothetical protein
MGVGVVCARSLTSRSSAATANCPPGWNQREADPPSKQDLQSQPQARGIATLTKLCTLPSAVLISPCPALENSAAATTTKPILTTFDVRPDNWRPLTRYRDCTCGHNHTRGHNHTHTHTHTHTQTKCRLTLLHDHCTHCEATHVARHHQDHCQCQLHRHTCRTDPPPTVKSRALPNPDKPQSIETGSANANRGNGGV